MRSTSLMTCCVYVRRPSETSSNVGARPPSNATSASTFRFTSSWREMYSNAMVMVAACVWCPAAMMSFMSPHNSSSVYARSPVSGSSRNSIVSNRQICSISFPASSVAWCCARRFLMMSSPIFSRSSYAAVSSRRRPMPSFAPSSRSGSGVMNTSPMISADRWYASSIGFATNFASDPVITSRDFSRSSKL